MQNKKILLGICGGIAAYKCAELVRQLVKSGAEVKVVMTQAAEQFITPMTLQALSGNEIRRELFDHEAERAMSHIELARWADYLLIAPATANFLAKMTTGIADDLLSTLYLVTNTPVVICPAMNRSMWEHPATQNNLTILKQRGVIVIGPEFGEQACGEVGLGRMSEVIDIMQELRNIMVEPCLAAQHVLITAGPTREDLDPVRYISNYSSGKMGYALAQAAINAGAKVTLISGPTNLNPPHGVEYKPVKSAQQMFDCVMQELKQDTIFIGAAAIADYTVTNPAPKKLKKQDLGEDLQLKLAKTQDVIAAVVKTGKAKFVVGFAAETNNLLSNAQQKLSSKGVDLIVANDVSDDKVFGCDTNKVSLITKTSQIDLNLASKMIVAQQIIAFIATSMQNNGFDLRT
jgi:phosphopantothenoylcysteine decarboxylase / phosphopantothenate---cysteine ligase